MPEQKTTPAARTKGEPRDPWDTPAMRQWVGFKREHPDALVFFRMGDFYELFGDDAERAGSALGLTVTQRTKGIAMAGAPHHQLGAYLRRAVEAGLRAVVVDQVEDPATAKGVVERAITRVVTPGTLVDDDLLEGERAGPIVGVVGGADGRVHAASCDLSTGDLELFDAPEASLADELSVRGAREVVCAAGDDDAVPEFVRAAIDVTGAAATARPGWQFAPDEARGAVLEKFGVSTAEGFGVDDDDPALIAAGGLVRYLLETQAVGSASVPGAPARTLDHLRPPRREAEAGVCRLDHAAMRALEIERVLRSGEQEGGPTGAPTGAPAGSGGSLLGVFLHPPGGARSAVRTAMGRRLLRRWLTRPLSRAEEIAGRHDAVSVLLEDRRLGDEVGEVLSSVQDVERIAARVALGRATPRDLVGLGSSVGCARELASALGAAPALAGACGTLEGAVEQLAALSSRISGACVDQPPASLSSGGLIRDGVDAALDEARRLSRDAGSWLAEYQARLISEHDLPSLKVGYNRVFGYYIELPSAQAARAPDELVRKQTLKNAERFTTPELRAFEQDVTTAEQRALERERALFHELLAEAGGCHGAVRAFAEVAARLDVVGAFAETAARRGWVRPEMTDEPVLSIEGGRHPALEGQLGDRFVPNGLELGGGDGGGGPSLALITGPNMAGKSTYIRQSALLVVLASAGSYVPAARATIGTCDRVFTRVGADDALHRGRSTFMVEMIETATMLHNRTRRSLVVLDEIGRGTSTLDGLSLAWAIAEALAGEGERPGPRTLFATHYHELTELERERPGRVVNLHAAVREWRDEIVFVHEIRPGRAKGSYGVHVARPAGVPAEVTDRARELLGTLSVEQAGRGGGADAEPSVRDDAQMGLFGGGDPDPAAAEVLAEVLAELRQIELDGLTPLGAFDVLRGLVERARRDG